MSSQKISALPRKATPGHDDLLPLVDIQFGTANYINKKTTIGDVLKLATELMDAKIIELDPVFSVNGQGGNVLLGLSQLSDTALNSPLADNLLSYDASAARWINKPAADIELVLDCGEF
jgi:hypothetical protein